MQQQTIDAARLININPFVGGSFDYEKQLGWASTTKDDVTFKGIPDPEEIIELYRYMSEGDRRELDKLLAIETGSGPLLLPHQIVPWNRDDWETMYLNGGRGVGKTAAGSTACIEHLEAVGPRARVGIGAPTNADVRDVCLEGETGLITMYGHRFSYYNRSTWEARHVKGGYVKAMGTEKPKRWNGPQWSFLWFDEFSLCNRKAIVDALLGLRLGPKRGPWRARMLATLTPKGQKWVQKLLEAEDAYVPHYIRPDGKPRFPTTFDNPHLPERRVQLLKQKYMGTRLGMQEMMGLFIGDTIGAMWSHDIIRCETDPEEWPPYFLRIVVSIDPAGTAARRKADENATSEEDMANFKISASTAICVSALGSDGRIYILAWQAGQYSPNEWASKAVLLFRMFGADRIVAERNYGGDMVEATLRNVWKDAPITIVSASRGKAIRAEPVKALYEQGRVVHCMIFSDAEAQMCSFKNTDENEGADYVDSMVWGVWELMGWNENSGAGVFGHNPELDSYTIYT
jgi:phage terminase large subunit-like protein